MITFNFDKYNIKIFVLKSLLTLLAIIGVILIRGKKTKEYIADGRIVLQRVVYRSPLKIQKFIENHEFFRKESKIRKFYASLKVDFNYRIPNFCMFPILITYQIFFNLLIYRRTLFLLFTTLLCVFVSCNSQNLIRFVCRFFVMIVLKMNVIS